MNARRAVIRLTFSGVDISADINKHLLSLTYTDNEEDKTDDLQLSLDDREGVWLGKWLNTPGASKGVEISAVIVQKNWISTHAPLAGRDSKRVQITMHIFAITDKFQMFLRKMPTVRAFCFFFVREKRANFSANRPSDLCALVLRTIRSSVPRADTSACSRSVRFYSRTSCPSSKIEGCPFLGQ